MPDKNKEGQESQQEEKKSKNENILDIFLKALNEFGQKVKNLIPDILEKDKPGLKIKENFNKKKKKIYDTAREEHTEKELKKHHEKIKEIIHKIAGRPIFLPDIDKKELLENDIIMVWEDSQRQIKQLINESNAIFSESLAENTPQPRVNKLEDTELYIKNYIDQLITPKIEMLVLFMKNKKYDQVTTEIQKILDELENSLEKGNIIEIEKGPIQWTTIIAKNKTLNERVQLLEERKTTKTSQPKDFLGGLLSVSNLSKYIANLISALSAKTVIHFNASNEDKVKTTLSVLCKLYIVLEQYQSVLSRYREFKKRQQD